MNLSLSDSHNNVITLRSSSSVGPKSSSGKEEDDNGFGEITVGWQEKRFSPAEIKFYTSSREEDFHGNVLKMKFFRDVQVIKCFQNWVFSYSPVPSPEAQILTL